MIIRATTPVNKSLAAWLMMLLVFLLPINARAFTPADTALFGSVAKVSSQRRPVLAMQLYKGHCRKIPAAAAMDSLNKLVTIARGLNDVALECAVFEMRADYYSVNKGLNALSTGYYQSAIDFALDNHLENEAAVYTHKKGMYYFTFKQNVDASRYFLEAQDAFKKLGYNNVPDVSVYLAQEASFYFDIGDYDNAGQLLTEALKHPISIFRIKINAVNTLGLINRDRQKYEEALSYFDAVLHMAANNKDTVWVAIARGNIGSVYFLQHQYNQALPYITTDYETSLKYGERMNAVFALFRLVKINLINKHTAQAVAQLKQAALLIPRVRDGLRVRVSYYEMCAEAAEQQNKLAESLDYRKKLELAKDSLQLRNSVAAVAREKLNWEMAKNQNQVDKLNEANEIATLRRNTIIAGLFFIAVILWLVFNQRLLKANRDKRVLLSEKQKADEELQNAILELDRYTESLRRNNLAIEKFKKEIARLEVKVTNTAEAEHLEKLMQAHIMTDESWDEFKALFTKAHTSFFVAVKKTYPALSDTDTRLLALAKLKLSNREMANMLGITLEGIKKAKQRLRKKMNLDADMDIEQAVEKL